MWRLVCYWIISRIHGNTKIWNLWQRFKSDLILGGISHLDKMLNNEVEKFFCVKALKDILMKFCCYCNWCQDNFTRHDESFDWSLQLIRILCKLRLKNVLKCKSYRFYFEFTRFQFNAKSSWSIDNLILNRSEIWQHLKLIIR